MKHAVPHERETILRSLEYLVRELEASRRASRRLRLALGVALLLTLLGLLLQL